MVISSVAGDLGHARRLLDSALLLQSKGRYGASQQFLEQALADLSWGSSDSSTRELAKEVLGAMRSNLPYSLDDEPDDEPMEADGLALLDSLAPEEGDSSFSLDSATLAKYRAEAYMDPNAVFDLPIDINERVLANLSLFKDRIPAGFQRWLERKSRWEAMISARLAERGMPQDLIYLAMIESGFNSRAVSPAAAAGMWQFMPATGRMYGLKLNRYVDERRDPWKATDAAMDYLSHLYGLFGDWRLAMAAYNCGEGCVDRAIRRSGTRDYWQLPLPQETRNYVPRIFAAAILGKNPKLHGFDFKPWEPIASDTFTVEGGITLATVAQTLNVSPDSLFHLNPALVKGMTPPARESWLLRIPSGSRDRFAQAYPSLEKTYSAPEPQRIVHRVRRGETISSIAARYGVSPASVLAWNGLRSKKRLKAGRRLSIHVSDDVAVLAPVFREPPLSRVRTASTKRTLVAPAKYHTLRRGQTLSHVARRYGVSVANLQAWNGIRKGKVRAGERLQVSAPVYGEATASHREDRYVSTDRNRSSEEERTESSSARQASNSPKVHRVRSGQTLSEIAEKYGVSVSALRSVNGLKNDKLRLGQKLRLPQSPDEQVADNSSRKSIHERRMASLERKNGEDAEVESKPRANSRRTVKYRVRKGDSLYSIAKERQISVDAILELNGLRKGLIRPGQMLKLPQVSSR